MKWRGFECHVVVDGVKLTEYEDPQSSSDGKTQSCWIASQSGCEYHVELYMAGKPPALPLAYHLFIDNELVAHEFQRAEVWKSPVIVGGVGVDDGTMLRNFQFALVNSSDDDNTSPKDIAGLGSIRLTLRQCHVTDTILPAITYKTSTFDQEPTINEKSKKLAQHCTLLGEPHPTSRRYNTYQTHPVPEIVDEYRHTFIFKYQPIELLQAREIAPRPSKCEPEKSSDRKRLGEHDVICKEESEEEVEQDQDPEEIRELKEQKRRLQQEFRNLDEKLTRLEAGGSRPRKRVKLEYQERLTALNGQVFEISD